MIIINPGFEGSYDKNTGGFYEGYSSLPETESFTKEDAVELRRTTVELELEHFRMDKAEIDLSIQELKFQYVGNENNPIYQERLKSFEKTLEKILKNIEIKEEELSRLQ